MKPTLEDKIKAIVLEAFDTLFNRRDYAAAEKFWSPDYIQHSAHIPPGRDGLFNLIKASPPSLRYEHGLMMAEALGRHSVRSKRVGTRCSLTRLRGKSKRDFRRSLAFTSTSIRRAISRPQPKQRTPQSRSP